MITMRALNVQLKRQDSSQTAWFCSLQGDEPADATRGNTSNKQCCACDDLNELQTAVYDDDT